VPCDRSERRRAADMVKDMFTSAEPRGENFDEMLARLEAGAGLTPAADAHGHQHAKDSNPQLDGFERLGDSVLDKFSHLATWNDILVPAGWTEAKVQDSDTLQAWKRPGGTYDISAKVPKVAPGTIVVYSTDAGLPAGPGQKLNKAKVYAHLYYGGDLSAASTALVRGEALGLPTVVVNACKTQPRNPFEGIDTPKDPPSPNGSAPSDGNHGAQQVQPNDSPKATELSLILPELFYEERQVLQMIRSYAHSRGAPADPALYGMLARLSGMVPPQCRLDTGIGRGLGASLNLFVAAVGPSGTGKSSSSGVSKDLYPPPLEMNFRDGLPLGSGEGLVEAYMGWVSIDDPSGAVNSRGEPKQVKIKTQMLANAFFVADEGEVFTKMQERSGATIGPMIRSAWYGQTIGQQNADPDRRRVLDEGRYSMGMLVGFQPETVLPLLDDTAAGTPQRFMFCWTVDPTIPKTRSPFMLSPMPEQFRAPPAMMSLADTVQDEIWSRHVGRATGEFTVPRLDAHGDLTKAKLAGLLALLEKRHKVTEDDWRLAGIMWATSCQVRDELLRQGRLNAAREKASRTQDYVDREGMAEGARQRVREASAKVVRLARLVGKYVHDSKKPSRTVADATRRLCSEDRHLAGEAIDYAASAGWVIHNGTALEPGESMPSEAGH
jgi:hypothetical protein